LILIRTEFDDDLNKIQLIDVCQQSKSRSPPFVDIHDLYSYLPRCHGNLVKPIHFPPLPSLIRRLTLFLISALQDSNHLTKSKFRISSFLSLIIIHVKRSLSRFISLLTVPSYHYPTLTRTRTRSLADWSLSNARPQSVFWCHLCFSVYLVGLPLRLLLPMS
jgi:hypothetical protein